MRFVYLMFVLVFTAGGALQAQEFDAALLEGFSVEELTLMQKDNPEELAYWSTFAEKGFKFFENTKGHDTSSYEVVNIEGSLDAFNPLQLGLRPAERSVVYRIKGSASLLRVFSKKQVRALSSSTK